MNDTEGEFQQSDFLDKLDLGFTVFLVLSGVLTFPPAVFVYYRILTVPTFRTQFLMKLFVFNGFMNILYYLMHNATTQFVNWPSTYGIYTWLNATYIPKILKMLQDFANCAQWQSQFCISLNRLISMKHGYLLKQHGYSFFLISLLSSFFVSLVLCIPILFSHYHYFQIEVSEGVFAYIPGDVPGAAVSFSKITNDFRFSKITNIQYYFSPPLPSQIHMLGFAIVTLIVNVLTCIVLMMMRQEFKTQSRSRPEQGLLLSSFCSTIVHILNDAVLLMVFFTGLVGLSYSITLFVAIATTLPFWTMIGFAHTMRRAVFSGTALKSVVAVGGSGEGRVTQSQSVLSRH